jgi:hypothetical protein
MQKTTKEHALSQITEMLEMLRKQGEEFLNTECPLENGKTWNIDPFGYVYDLDVNDNRSRFWGWFVDSPAIGCIICDDYSAYGIIQKLKGLGLPSGVTLEEQAEYTVSIYLEK